MMGSHYYAQISVSIQRALPRKGSGSAFCVVRMLLREPEGEGGIQGAPVVLLPIHPQYYEEGVLREEADRIAGDITGLMRSQGRVLEYLVSDPTPVSLGDEVG